MVQSAFHWATLSVAVGALLAAACSEESDGDRGSAGASGTAGASASGGGGNAGAGGGNAGTGGGDAGSGSAGAPEVGGGGTPGMNDCDPRKVMCRRAAPVCDEAEAPSVEGSCYGPCVPIASCACSSAEECPLPDLFTCHLSRGRCDYYVR